MRANFILYVTMPLLFLAILVCTKFSAFALDLIGIKVQLMQGNKNEKKTPDLMEKEWLRSNPDIIVYLPRGEYDGDNEHFLVFESPGGDELMAVWTQSSVEGRGNNHLCFSRTRDGKNWAEPMVIAGVKPGEKGMQASWGFPIVSKAGRIYCFYTKETEYTEPKMRQSSGTMGCKYSDDNGYLWIEGKDIPVPHNKYDNPDPSIHKNWIVFQKPLRDGNGYWIAGYTQWSSSDAVPPPTKNWPDQDSRCGFLRFENIDEDPDPKDLRVTWLPRDRLGLEVPHKTYPELSVAQEPALIFLPDGRLFTVMRTMTGYAWYSVSDDGGDTWRAPEVLRFCDNGEKIQNPMVPSPLYRLLDGRYLFLFYNNNGERGDYNQFKKIWDNGNQLNYLRNPAFISIGEFRPDARQPVWFSKPKQILDTDGVVFGPKGTAEIATYASLTEWKGKRVLWYPDRKHFLLGKYLSDELLSDMRVPE